MTVEVSVRAVAPTPTAVVAATVTWAEFPVLWKPMLDQVWSFLRGDAPEGLYRQGHNVMLYKDDVPNVEVGVQVTGSFDSVGRVTASSLPGGLVATATHTGAVSAIGDTHQAVRQWGEANGYRPAGPRWEIYGDPDRSTGDFLVEVLWLLAALHPAEVELDDDREGGPGGSLPGFRCRLVVGDRQRVELAAEVDERHLFSQADLLDLADQDQVVAAVDLGVGGAAQ
jgi:effector-binding domain-containing protein